MRSTQTALLQVVVVVTILVIVAVAASSGVFDLLSEVETIDIQQPFEVPDG